MIEVKKRSKERVAVKKDEWRVIIHENGERRIVYRGD